MVAVARPRDRATRTGPTSDDRASGAPSARVPGRREAARTSSHRQPAESGSQGWPARPANGRWQRLLDDDAHTPNGAGPFTGASWLGRPPPHTAPRQHAPPPVRPAQESARSQGPMDQRIESFLADAAIKNGTPTRSRLLLHTLVRLLRRPRGALAPWRLSARATCLRPGSRPPAG
jgi:hypothetical protein